MDYHKNKIEQSMNTQAYQSEWSISFNFTFIPHPDKESYDSILKQRQEKEEWVQEVSRPATAIDKENQCKENDSSPKEWEVPDDLLIACMVNIIQ